MLLTSDEFRGGLRSLITDASNEILLLSAFIKRPALEWIVSHACIRNISVVARWKPQDLLSGASDLESYMFCRDQGIKFGVSTTLHGKVYLADDQILVGSANATAKGLALAEGHNDEFGVGFSAGPADRQKLLLYLNTVAWLNDELYFRIAKELAAIEDREPALNVSWSSTLEAVLSNKSQSIWSHELPLLSPVSILEAEDRLDPSLIHDLDLLDITEKDLSETSLRDAFRRARCFHWLHQKVIEHGTMSFGRLSAALHEDLLDDPTPYRRQVKELVANLFDWASFVGTPFVVSRPNYSQIIELTDSNTEL